MSSIDAKELKKGKTLPPLESIRKIHIVGVCGTLMGAFAAYLKRSGYSVTGSDQNIYPPMSDVLQQAGVELLRGYEASHLTNAHLGGAPDLVVIGNVIRSDNPEARAAIEGGYAYTSLPEAMENLFLTETKNVVVAGTHGKTTTSSLLAHTLVHCQKDPNYFIGGVSEDLPHSFHLSRLEKDQLFVLEGDEYDTAFWDKVPKFNHYLPNHVILTSIEYDHADIYPDLRSVVRAFEGLLSRIRPGGHILSCFDYPVVRDLMCASRVPVISYGSSYDSTARFTPGKVTYADGYTRFDVLDYHKKVDEVTFRLSGLHNVLNALAVWIECQELGLDPQLVREGLKSFRGVKRRQEVRGEVRGVMVIDDFAHHPTAVRETLRALRMKYAGRRLIAVFEPRSATSRRKVFQKDYAVAFQEADQIYISSPYDQSHILQEDQFSSEVLVDDLKRLGKNANFMSTVEEGVEEISKMSESGDLIAVLSNGGFGGFVPKLLDSLKK